MNNQLVALAAILTILMSIGTAIGLLWLGYDYHVDGRGLHPAVAVTMALIFIGCAFAAGARLLSLICD